MPLPIPSRFTKKINALQPLFKRLRAAPWNSNKRDDALQEISTLLSPDAQACLRMGRKFQAYENLFGRNRLTSTKNKKFTIQQIEDRASKQEVSWVKKLIKVDQHEFWDNTQQ